MALLALRALALLLGAYVVWGTLVSALQTFVLPRGANTRLARVAFSGTRAAMELWVRGKPYETRDRVLALLAPVGLVVLPGIWLLLVFLGFTAAYLGLGVDSLRAAVLVSGSFLFTLGFEHPDPARLFVVSLAGFLESAIGLGLLALLISYLPTIYSGFSRRETLVSMLEAVAGSPPSPVTMLMRHQRISGLDRLDATWRRYQEWFADIEESHVSLAALVFLRSPQPYMSWVVVAGCIMDAAALMASSVAVKRSPDAELCIRAGFICLRRVADFFNITYDLTPRPDDPTSISREEFLDVFGQLEAAGLPMKTDREQCFRDFNGWRVNYDTVLRHLAGLTAAPPAMWSGDRAVAYRNPPLLAMFRRRRVTPPPPSVRE